MILGLTGGYCAGKSTAAAILKDEGWTIIDVDALGHRALELSASAVADILGPQVLGPDGRPDRRAIGAIVFADPRLLERYEAVVHPAMNALVAEAVAGAGERACVDAALLYRLPVAGDMRCHHRNPHAACSYGSSGPGFATGWGRWPRSSGSPGSGSCGSPGTASTASDTVVWNRGDRGGLERRLHSVIRSIISARGLN